MNTLLLLNNMEIFYQILIGSILLSLIHASIPNHWLPLVAIGRTEKWNSKETLSVTAITGAAHTLSTIFIGIVIGLLGYKLSSSYGFITKVAAPLILIALGIIYLIIDRRENHSHHRHHHFDENKIIKEKGRNKVALITSLSVAMFFSPCIEIEAYYFTASGIGWTGIATVSIVYFLITIAGMLLLVYLGLKGIEKFNFHFMEHHEKLVTGAVLVLLGIITFIIE